MHSHSVEMFHSLFGASVFYHKNPDILSEQHNESNFINRYEKLIVDFKKEKKNHHNWNWSKFRFFENQPTFKYSKVPRLWLLPSYLPNSQNREYKVAPPDTISVYATTLKIPNNVCLDILSYIHDIEFRQKIIVQDYKNSNFDFLYSLTFWWLLVVLNHIMLINCISNIA